MLIYKVNDERVVSSRSIFIRSISYLVCFLYIISFILKLFQVMIINLHLNKFGCTANSTKGNWEKMIIFFHASRQGKNLMTTSTKKLEELMLILQRREQLCNVPMKLWQTWTIKDSDRWCWEQTSSQQNQNNYTISAKVKPATSQ